ncbi:uncharacterized protein OCT59_024792 [Rhizophagus irregularis]|nr:hypothetical protein OCT59_024792 [Rhizophagus irregularis]
MFKLNEDILFLVIEKLKDDSKSLFSCLMVNKLWCENTIPILWRNPWSYDIDYYNDNNYLFTIIISYLSDDIKEFLIRQGIQLPSPSISPQSLSFDYLSFCKSINIIIINIIISIKTSLIYNQFLLQQEFYKLFMKKCSELIYLNMKSIKHQIYYFPDANNRLETLYELECDTSIDSSYYYGLARICKCIQRIIIFNVNPKDNHGIAKLIEVQKNLKYFEWNDDFKNIDFTYDPYEEILFELEKKTNILKHLKIFLHYVDNFERSLLLLQNVLMKLNGLKTLMGDFSIFGEHEMKMLYFNNLEILHIDCITLIEASIIIENSGGKLKEVSIKPYDFVYYEDNFSEDTLIFIRKIYQKCPLIEVLSLAFSLSKDHFIEFENLLKICQNLKSLLLFTSNFHIRETEEKILESGEEILKILISSASNNLREIRFFNNFKFSLGTLENFLENWRGRPALSILTSSTIYEEEDYKNLIDDYKNDGVIKTFKYESVINVENMNFRI